MERFSICGDSISHCPHGAATQEQKVPEPEQEVPEQEQEQEEK